MLGTVLLYCEFLGVSYIVSHAVGHEVGHMAGQEVGHGEVSTLNYQNSSGSMLAPQPLTTTRVKRCQGS